MAKSQSGERRGWWERADVRIGVVTGLLGLIPLALGLPAAVTETFTGSKSKAAAADAERKRAELAEAGPRVDVSYVVMRDYLVQEDADAPPRSRAKANAASTVRSFPIVGNEVLAELDSNREPSAKGCRMGKYTASSVALLVVTNRGRRDAADIELRGSLLQLAGTVRVHEKAVGGDDYVAKLRGRTSQMAPVTVRLPQTLGPGDGVRIPIFISVANNSRGNPWCVVSRRALVPQSVKFVDPALDSTTESVVRRMVNPVGLASGIIARG
jgi:hypothetical protein